MVKLRGEGMHANVSRLKILFVHANPDATAPLRLDHELRAIHDALRGSPHGHGIDVLPCPAARPNDLRRALLTHKPHVVHFSGHGTDKAILFEGENFGEKPVGPEALAGLLSVFREHVRTVLLNACFSEPLAKHITK